MEPQWTKSISNESVCNFFYFFFVLYAVIFVLSILATIGVMASKVKGMLGVALGTQAIVTTLIGGTMMLFYYLVCDRALLHKNQNEGFVTPMSMSACPTGKTYSPVTKKCE
jgi:hypothetical protein